MTVIGWNGILASVVLLAGLSARADFSYEGYLTNASGTPVTDSSVTFKFQILDPTQTCILYEEQQVYDLSTATTGYYSMMVGSPVGATKRTSGDSGNAFEKVFASSAAIPGKLVSNGSACSPSLAIGDVRYMRVTVTATSIGAPEVLSPNIVLNAAPNATVAQTLDGALKTDFLQINATSNLSQANLQSIFAGSNYSKLTNLIALDPTTFVTAPVGGGMMLPSSSGTPGSAANGQMWFNSTTGTLNYKDNSGVVQTISTAGGAVTLPSLTNGKLWVGNGGNAAMEVAPSGVVSMSPSGVFSFAGMVPVAFGGTGQSSFAPNSLLMANGTGTSIVSSSCALGQYLASDVSGNWICTNPSWMTPNGNNIAAPIQLGTNDNYPLALKTNGLAKMWIMPTGAVGIGTQSPSANLHVSSPVPNQDMLRADCGSSGFCQGIFMTGTARMDIGADSAGNRVYLGSQTNVPLELKTNDITRVKIDQAGNVGIGVSAPSVPLDIMSPSAGISLKVTNFGGSGGVLMLQGANGSVGTPSPKTTGSFLGQFMFGGFDGASFNGNPSSMIGSLATENWSPSTHGSALSFMTTLNGTSSLVERMRIDQNGDVGIGTNMAMNDYSAASTLHLHAGINNAMLTHYTNSTTGPMPTQGTYVGYFGSALALANPVGGIMTRGSGDDLILGTMNQVRVLVKGPSGYVGIGTANPTVRLEVAGDVKVAGHIVAGGNPTSIGTCGSGGSVSGNDSRGKVTTGTSASGCTINFGSPWTSAPICVVSWSGGTAPSYMISADATTTQMTVNFNGSVSGGIFNYVCVQ